MNEDSGNGGHQGQEPPVKLNDIPAKVVRVHVDGIGRTKESLIMKNLAAMFNVTHFEDLVIQAQGVRTTLQDLGCFSNVDVQIDTAKDDGKSSYEVTFKVNELKRFSGAVNTMMGNQEGSVSVGLKSPNVFGQGEKFQIDYSHGTKKTSQFNVGLNKPLHDMKTQQVAPNVSLNAFQQIGELPWSAYKELNRGLLLDLSFLSAPQVSHNLQYEASWRNLSCLNSSAFAVREQCGHSLKSALKHILSVDRRDNNVFPTEGSFFKLYQEFAGIGGDIGFFKNELESQINIPVPTLPNVTVQGSFHCGHTRRMASTGDTVKTMTIADRFFVGGPLNVRGFEMRGLGPSSENCALGGLTYWAAGLHLYSALPFASSSSPALSGFFDLFRLHTFLNAGNLMSDYQFDVSSKSFQANIDEAVQNFRLTYGLGLAFKLGGIARIELNYCVPLRTQKGDKPAPGLQFGVGVDFL